MDREPTMLSRLTRPLTTNEASTRPGGAYPELQPATYARDPDVVFEAAERAIEGRSGWRIVDRGGVRRRLDVEVSTRVFGFIDDVRIDVEESEEGAVVHARSRSRAGVGDFGKNARTIREFFERLSSELERESRADAADNDSR